MKNIQKLEFYAGSKEELLPGFESEFPYIASNAELDKYAGHSVPWHWHKAIELFYMESGTLEYYTPKKNMSFPAGSGGFINSNVLHMTKAVSQTERNIQRLHIFDTALISGNSGSRIEKKYVMPIGGGCIILAGVTIGENSVIGAGSVVTRSIPANCVAVGNPCKVIRCFAEEREKT